MKVFLSSTGRDLKSYREAAFAAIQGMGHHCVRMEDFHGEALKIEDFDDRRVAECDLFVILIGQLHGTCPEGSEKSYTELECETAQKLGKPCFIFLTDEDFGLPNRLRESDAKFALQQAFRQRAVKGIIRHTFTSPDDLAKQIVQALHDWHKSQANPASPEPFLPTPPQPYFVHPYPLQENFTGRRTERRMLSDWLTGNRPVLSLCAIGGMGKSALTWAWLQRDVLGLPLPGATETEGEASRVPEADRPEGVLWWSFYERDATFGNFVREALRYASAGRAQYASPYDQLQALAAILAQKHFLLVLDGFERELWPYAGPNVAYQQEAADERDRRCVDPHAGTFLRFVASQAIASRILLTTRLHPKELDGLAGCEHQELASMDPEDAVRFFYAQGVKGTRAEIHEACAPYGFHPLALRLLAGLIVKDRRNPGDIRVALRYPVAEHMSGTEKRHILQVAYDAMEKPATQEMLGRLAAFRSPMSYDSLLARRAPKMDEFLVFLCHASGDKPAVRGLYQRLRADGFAPWLDEENLIPGQDWEREISAAVRASGVALVCLSVASVTKEGFFQKEIKYALDVADEKPEGTIFIIPVRLEDCGVHERLRRWHWVNLFEDSGYNRLLSALRSRQNAAQERANEARNRATGLANVASDQFCLGQLREADQSIRRSIALFKEAESEWQQAVGHQQLGLLEAYEGRASESARELDAALGTFREQGDKQSEGTVHIFRALLTLLAGAPQQAVKHAREARETANLERGERDLVPSEWLLGWSLIHRSPAEAEIHLTEALTRCRRINMIELEPDILIAFTRWHRAAKNRDQALAHVREALAIANRFEYRLVQADCHNLLAQLALDSGDRVTALREAAIAKERAYCDGPPHYYKPAYDEAESILKRASG